MSDHPTTAPSIRNWVQRHKNLPKEFAQRIYEWFVSDRHSDYGFAVMRIASGLLITGWLLFNLPIASKIWGPGSAYLSSYREILGYVWPLNILEDAGNGFFWVWYSVAILLAIAFTVGWKARLITPLLFIFYTAINAQNTPISDGGNYFIRIMLIYLILVDVSRRWSLDSWLRQRKQSKNKQGPVRKENEIVTVLHNLGLVLVIAQLCIVYFEAGMYKVQGTLWQNGTAVYYPLNSDIYGVFPWASELLTANSWMVVGLTYMTVLVQVAFPFLLFHRITRRIGLILILGMHLGIAIFMGLPFFSGIMASADAVLVSGATWATIQGWLKHQIGRITARSTRKDQIPDDSGTDQETENRVTQPV